MQNRKGCSTLKVFVGTNTVFSHFSGDRLLNIFLKIFLDSQRNSERIILNQCSLCPYYVVTRRFLLHSNPFFINNNGSHLNDVIYLKEVIFSSNLTIIGSSVFKQFCTHLQNRDSLTAPHRINANLLEDWFVRKFLCKFEFGQRHLDTLQFERIHAKDVRNFILQTPNSARFVWEDNDHRSIWSVEKQLQKYRLESFALVVVTLRNEVHRIHKSNFLGSHVKNSSRGGKKWHLCQPHRAKIRHTDKDGVGIAYHHGARVFNNQSSFFSYPVSDLFTRFVRVGKVDVLHLHVKIRRRHLSESCDVTVPLDVHFVKYLHGIGVIVGVLQCVCDSFEGRNHHVFVVRTITQDNSQLF